MARRRMRTSATGGNMDSMLDTLTNVVGILLIVLVTVQLSSQEAASRIAAAVQKLEPGAAERIAAEAAEAEAAADRAQAALDRRLQGGRRDPAAEAARLEAERARAEKAAQESANRAAALERDAQTRSAAAEAASRKVVAERSKAEAEVKQAEQRREALAAELAKTEKPIPPPARQVRLPDPRPAPAGAKELRVLCREGRLWVIDPAAVQSQVLKRATFLVKQKKLDPDGDNWLADGAALAKEFNKEPVLADDFKVTMTVSGDAFTLLLTRVPGSGQPVEQSVKPLGDLGRALRRCTPADHYVRFFVWPDGFEAYLGAREVAAEREFAAGWEPMGSPDEYRMGFYSLRVGKKPPPSPPTSKPPQQPAQNVVD